MNALVTKMDFIQFFKKYKKFIPLFLTLGIFLFYLTLYIVQEKLVTQDGTLWISYGLQIFQGDLQTFQFDGGAPSFSPLVYSPGYPFLVGLVNLVIQNPVHSAYLISMLMSALLCLVVFYISKNIFNEKIGYISLLLCGVYTGMKHYATETWIRSTGMFFLLLGLYLFLLSLKKNKIVYPLLTGAVLGAAVLVRFEFALYPILAGVLFLFYVVRKKLKFRSLVYFSSALLIVYFLYSVPLYLNSGFKLLSPYISEKLLGEKMPDKPQFNYYPNRDIADYIVLFNNNTASSINLSKQNKVKVSQEDWEQYRNQENSTSDTSGIFGNYQQMFHQIIPLVFRWHIIGFFILGIYFSFRNKKTQSFGLYGLIGITLLVYPLGSVEAIRYYHHLQPLILIIASCGLFFAAESIKKIFKSGVVYYAMIALVL
ncbi:glycosyltransferase family 39 protein, partial [Acidobacteriota bacterium]